MTSKTKLYIVYGSTGEWSDRGEWAVIAYTDEALAQCHVAAATRWYQENNCFELRHKAEFNNPFDPNMSIDYTGTHWYVGRRAISLRESLPEDHPDAPKVLIYPEEPEDPEDYPAYQAKVEEARKAFYAERSREE